MLIAVRDLVQGAQISAPNGKYAAAVDVLEALGEHCPPVASTRLSRSCRPDESLDPSLVSRDNIIHGCN